MNYFEMLTNIEKQKVLKKVNRLFNKAHYYKTLFKFKIFKNKYPLEYKTKPIGNLEGNALSLHECLFQESQKWVYIIFEKLTQKQSLKILARRKS